MQSGLQAGDDDQEGNSVTSHRIADIKLPNINGWHDALPKHSMGYRAQHRVRSAIASIVAAVLVFVGTAAAAVWVDLNSAISNGSVNVIPQGKMSSPTLVDPNAGKAIEFLVVGQDSRDGSGNASLGGSTDDAGSHQADTTMVVQISADRSYINLVSIPRDSLVDVPSCQTSKGTIPAQYNVMFNSIFAGAWSQGGDLSSAASCTLAAVNSLTGLKLENFIVVDFAGLRDMIDAIGGVNLCIPEDTQDSYTNLNLKKGLQHLNGTQATQYARMRHGTGTDGSDIMRTTRQQYLVKELLKQAMQKNLFTQTSQLYQLAKATLKALSLSTGLASTTTLAGLAMSLKNMPTSNFFTQTIPVTTAPSDINRVVWASTADAVWAKLRSGKPLTEKTQITAPKKSGKSASSSPSASASTSSSSSSTASSSSTPSINPTTGLTTDSQGNLIDPNTGGIVDPANGTIRDPNTGQYIGIADRYLNATVCAIPAQD